MKICCKCGIVKLEHEFYKLKSNLLCGQCKLCCNLYDRVRYKKRFKNMLFNAKSRLIRNRDFIDAFKLSNNTCMECGLEFIDYYILEFDHLSDKKFSIGKNKSMAIDRVINEISKCEIVCCNCHRHRTKLNYAMISSKKNTKRQKIIQYINECFKSTPCVDCGMIYKPYQTDFDHINSDNKYKCISTMIRDNESIEKIISEISKCELVCANCHKVRTYNRRHV